MDGYIYIYILIIHVYPSWYMDKNNNESHQHLYYDYCDMDHLGFNRPPSVGDPVDDTVQECILGGLLQQMTNIQQERQVNSTHVGSECWSA